MLSVLLFPVFYHLTVDTFESFYRISVNRQQREKALSETYFSDLFITPAIRHAGWNLMRPIRREVTLTPDPVIVRGNQFLAIRKKSPTACCLDNSPYNLPALRPLPTGAGCCEIWFNRLSISL